MIIPITVIVLIGAGFGAAVFHLIPKCALPKPVESLAGLLFFALVTTLVKNFSNNRLAWFFVLGAACYMTSAAITRHFLKKKRAREQAAWQKEMQKIDAAFPLK